MDKSFIRVLVVDDYEPIRQRVRSVLERSPEFEIVGEAFDGLHAVQLARELQPDLIVLDIGLPTLNGLDAARQIRVLSPQSKILFLSQHSSLDFVQEALRSGASGYVLKAYAGMELLDAAQAVCQGRQYVGSGLSDDNFASGRDTLSALRQLKRAALSSLAKSEAETSHRHRAHFFEDDGSLLVGFARFIKSALDHGNGVLVVATESRRKSLVQQLLAGGIDLASSLAQGRYIPLDADQTLASFMKNDQLDPARFFKLTGELIERAAKASKGEPGGVSACGECAPLLLAQGRPEAAIQLEQLWDQVARKRGVDIMCGYLLNNSQPEPEPGFYESICAHHSGVQSHSAGY